MSLIETHTHWPALSLQAWEKTMVALSADEVDEPSFFAGFRVERLPNSERLWALENDEWVFRYEAHQARLARAARKNGLAQDGVFYTPAPIARYLAQRTLGMMLADKMAQIEAAAHHSDKVRQQEILQTVQQLRVIDPACGTGIFLVEASKLLQGFYQDIHRRFPVLLRGQDLEIQVLGQLYGVDLDPVSVAIAEFRLTKRVAPNRMDAGKELGVVLNRQFTCADTLLDNPFEAMQWDVVLGNPPYVSEVRKQSGRLKAVQRQGEFYQAKMDLCDAFTAWAVRYLQPSGQLAYVLPEYWMQRTSSVPLRHLLWQAGSFLELWTLGNQVVFKEAPGHHTSFLIWQKHSKPTAEPAQSQPVLWGCAFPESPAPETELRTGVLLSDPQSGKLILTEPDVANLLSRLSSLPPLLKPSEIQQGVVLPQGRLRRSDWLRLPQVIQATCPPDAGIFLLTPQEVNDLALSEIEHALLKPYYGPSGFLPFQGSRGRSACYQLLYTDRKAREQIARHPERYAALTDHLDRFSLMLTSAFKPYGLHRPRQPQWFECAYKILSPRQVLVPAFAVVVEPAYVAEGFYSIVPMPVSPDIGLEEESQYRVSLLNSKLARFWFYHQKRKGNRLQIDKDVLLAFPAPSDVTNPLKKEMATLAKALSNPALNPSDRTALWETLNDRVYTLYGLEPDAIRCVTDHAQAMDGAGQ